MSSGKTRRHGKNAGLAVLAMVSLAIFAAQIDSQAVDTRTVVETGLDAKQMAKSIITTIVNQTLETLTESVPELNPALVEVAIDESQHPRLATESDDRGQRETF